MTCTGTELPSSVIVTVELFWKLRQAAWVDSPSPIRIRT